MLVNKCAIQCMSSVWGAETCWPAEFMDDSKHLFCFRLLVWDTEVESATTERRKEQKTTWMLDCPHEISAALTLTACGAGWTVLQNPDSHEPPCQIRVCVGDCDSLRECRRFRPCREHTLHLSAVFVNGSCVLFVHTQSPWMSSNKKEHDIKLLVNVEDQRWIQPLRSGKRERLLSCLEFVGHEVRFM